MSIETAGHAISVKDAFLSIAQDICMTERGVSIDNFETRTWIDWTGDAEIFSPVLALKRVFIQKHASGVLSVMNATFELPEKDISVQIDRGITSDLNGDPFLIPILEKFEGYSKHEHTLCLAKLAVRESKRTAGLRMKTNDNCVPHA